MELNEELLAQLRTVHLQKIHERSDELRLKDNERLAKGGDNLIKYYTENPRALDDEIKHQYNLNPEYYGDEFKPPKELGSKVYFDVPIPLPTSDEVGPMSQLPEDNMDQSKTVSQTSRTHPWRGTSLDKQKRTEDRKLADEIIGEERRRREEDFDRDIILGRISGRRK